MRLHYRIHFADGRPDEYVADFRAVCAVLEDCSLRGVCDVAGDTAYAWALVAEPHGPFATVTVEEAPGFLVSALRWLLGPVGAPSHQRRASLLRWTYVAVVGRRVGWASVWARGRAESVGLIAQWAAEAGFPLESLRLEPRGPEALFGVLFASGGDATRARTTQQVCAERRA